MVLKGNLKSEPELLSGERSVIVGQGSGEGDGWYLSLICSFIPSMSKHLLSSCSGSRSVLGSGTSGVPNVLESVLGIRGLAQPLIVLMGKQRPTLKAPRG